MNRAISADHLENSISPRTAVQRLTAAAFMLVVACIAVSSTGCAAFQGVYDHFAYNDTENDFVLGWRNRVWAQQAWHERKQMYQGHPQFRAFGQGFRDGYASVAGGGGGCLPLIPPRTYWSWRYQTGEGQAKVAAWFEGYPEGARAADEDCAGNFQDIQVSYLAEIEYSPEFQAGRLPQPGPNRLPYDGQVIPIEEVPGQALDSANRAGQPVSPALDAQGHLEQHPYRPWQQQAPAWPTHTGAAAPVGYTVP